MATKSIEADFIVYTPDIPFNVQINKEEKITLLTESSVAIDEKRTSSVKTLELTRRKGPLKNQTKDGW